MRLPARKFQRSFLIQMKPSLGFAVILASGIVLSAAAQTSAAPAATPTAAPGPAPAAKIAVVQFQLAVGQTNEGQRDFADVEKKFEPRQEKLKALNDEIETLAKQLQTQGATLSESDRAAKAAAIETKKKQLDRDAEDARNDFQQAVQDAYNGLASKVYDVMMEYSEKNGYTLVLDASQQTNPVLYASPGSVITKAVIDAYNVKSGVPAPPPSAAKPAATTHPGTTTPHPASSTTSH
jgi:outer membrane protein